MSTNEHKRARVWYRSKAQPRPAIGRRKTLPKSVAGADARACGTGAHKRSLSGAGEAPSAPADVPRAGAPGACTSLIGWEPRSRSSDLTRLVCQAASGCAAAGRAAPVRPLPNANWDPLRRRASDSDARAAVDARRIWCEPDSDGRDRPTQSAQKPRHRLDARGRPSFRGVARDLWGPSLLRRRTWWNERRPRTSLAASATARRSGRDARRPVVGQRRRVPQPNVQRSADAGQVASQRFAMAGHLSCPTVS